MKKINIIRAIRDLFLYPSRFYEHLAENSPNVRLFFLTFGVPLMAAGAVGRMLRVVQQQALADAVPGTYQLVVGFLVSLCIFILSIYAGAMLIARMAKAFDGKQDADKSMLLCLTAYLPFLLAQILVAIHPVMGFVTYAGLLHTVILIGKGAGPLLNVPVRKTTGFALTGSFILFGISAVLFRMLFSLFIFGA